MLALAPAAALRARRCCTSPPRPRRSRCCARARSYRAAALAQVGLLAAAAAGGRVRLRPLLLARYYVATTAALGAGPLRPPAPRHARGVGGGRGHAVSYRGQARARRRRRGLGARRSARPCSPSRRVLIRLESHGHPIYRQRRVGRDGAPFELYKLRTMVARRRDDRRRASRSTRATRGSRGSAACCGARRWTSCPTSSTCCAARCRSSARGRPCRSRSTATRSASAAGSRSSPG